MKHWIFWKLTIFCIHICLSMEETERMLNVVHHQTAFVSKVEPHKQKPTLCDCYNATELVPAEIECRCFGNELKEIPSVLPKNLQRITISDSDIKNLSRNSLQPYKETLMDVILENLPFLRVIEHGIFRDIPNLRTVYISHAPQIKFLHRLFEGVTSTKFLSLRIVHTSLHEVPDLLHIPQQHIMHMVDLEGNKITKLPSNVIKIQAEQVTLNYNEISEVDDYAFNGSRIGKLSLRGNRKLVKIGEYAFNGLQSLLQLDLSETSIDSLPPGINLNELEILKIERTPSMKVIPSIYYFPALKEAYLTHPFHCCAFKYPEQHDPKKHALMEESMKKLCPEETMTTTSYDTGQFFEPHVKMRRKRNAKNYEDNGDGWWNSAFDLTGWAVSYESSPSVPEKSDEWGPSVQHLKFTLNKSDNSHLNPLVGQVVEHHDHDAHPIITNSDDGYFHRTTATVNDNVVMCGNLSAGKRNIQCYPEPNALNPCEDIMGSYWLRISVWFVVVFAIVGNLAVMIVVIFSGGEMTVSKFLMCNLAFADFCMGLYLLLIASMDLQTVGSYFNFAYDWQYGTGCQVAGFLTVFASHLSVFTLAVVTVERWFAITYAIHLTKRIRIGTAAKTMVVGWVYSIFIAAIPLFGVSNYSSTSICLPMEVNTMVDKAYIFTMILTNGLAFALIVFCYAQIYFSLTYETRRSSSKGEMTIAKKMALLVFTDFACWAPIAFFSLTALLGYPLIGVTRSKILLVFFYPLNSCANPYLYAIMTAQYRRDLFLLLARLKICTKTAHNYTLSTSVQTNNTTHPIPLLTRSNGKHQTKKPSDGVEDQFV